MERNMFGYRLLPVTLMMGSIFYLSHQPGHSFYLPDFSHSDKVLHGLVYAALGIAFLFALTPSWRARRPVLAGWAALLFCLLYGVSDEFHQSFIPGRMASTADLAADAGGGVMAVIGDWGWKQWRKARKPLGAPP